MRAIAVKRFVITLATSFILCLNYSAVSAAGFIVGVATHFGQNKGDVDKSLSMMKDIGITSFRDEMYWSVVEKTKDDLRIGPELNKVSDAVAKARARGIEPLIVFDYGNKFYGTYPVTPEAQDAFARYAAHVAKVTQARYFEVWNEWSTGAGAKVKSEWSAPGPYVDLLKKVYPAVKAVRPDAVIIGGAVDVGWPMEWIEEMLHRGAADYMDGLSIHPYVFHAGKEGTPERLFALLSHVTDRVAQSAAGKQVPIYITEVGWPAREGQNGVTQSQLADYVARTYLLARTFPTVQGAWWFQLQDDDRSGFGLLDSKSNPTDAYRTMGDVAPLVQQATRVERLFPKSPIWVVQLTKSDGGKVIAVWDPRSKAGKVELSIQAAAAQKLTVSRTGGDRKPAQQIELRAGANTVPLDVNSSPTLIDTKGAAVEVRDVKSL